MNSSPPFHPTPLDQPVADDSALRETLKRCSPATLEAVQHFRRTGDLVHLPAIVHGVIARYVDPELRPKLSPSRGDLRLNEDLGLDSLTMMEIVLLAEEVLKISINYEELCHLRTVGDVNQFLVFKVRNPLLGGALKPCPPVS